MNILVVGCEYAGTTTLAVQISDWTNRALGGAIHGGLSFHDHFKGIEAGHVGPDGPREITGEDLEDELSWSAKHRQSYRQYMMAYHVQQGFFGDPHHLMLGMHFDDEVYGPRYLGYGEDKAGLMRLMSIHTEAKIMRHGPDTVLVLVKASPEVIRRRMRESPHPHGVLRDDDVEDVLAQFDDLYAGSHVGTLGRRFVLDTSEATVEETMAEFVENMARLMPESDRLRMMTRNIILDTV